MREWQMIYLSDAELYLIYFNDFLSVERFAEYYGLSVEYARDLINRERVANHDLALTIKAWPPQ